MRAPRVGLAFLSYLVALFVCALIIAPASALTSTGTAVQRSKPPVATSSTVVPSGAHVLTVRTPSASTARTAVKSVTAPTAAQRELIAEKLWLSTPAAKCIEFHESTDGKFSSNIWQFQGYPWAAGTGPTVYIGALSVAEQGHYAFVLFEQRSWEPWAADAGVCHLRW